MIGSDENELMKIFGNAYQSLSDYQKAIEYHEICFKIVEEISDWAGQKRAYGNFW